MRTRDHYEKSRVQLYRERFRLSAYETPHERSDVPIGKVLKTIFKKLDSENQSWFGQLEREWTELIGTPASCHTRPGYFKRNTLVIYVDSTTWLNELLRYKRTEILKHLQNKFGREQIKFIRFHIAPRSFRQQNSVVDSDT